MTISRILDTQSNSLNSTSGSAVTVPATIDTVTALSVVCRNTAGTGNIEWKMLDSAADAVGKTMPDSEYVIDFRLNPGQTAFWAKTLSGNGLLEVGYFQ